MTLPVIAVADSGNNTPRSAFATAPNSAWTAGGNLPTLANGSGGSWSGIAYSPSLNRVVAIGEGSDNNNNVVATSDDQGATWTGRAVPNQNTWTMNGICWSAALSLFVIVASAGPTTTTRILTSPDGITWTARTIPDATKSLLSVAWSPELALFCAVGNSNYIITSPDGTTWTARTGPATSKNWVSICWAGDGLGGGLQMFAVVATGAGGSNDFMHSADGLTWTQQTLSGSAFSWQCIAYSPDQNRLAVVGGNTGVVVHSTNGTSWTEISSGLGSTAFRGICWSSSIGLWVGVCNGTNVLTSANGTSWTNNTGVAPATQGWRRVVAVTANASELDLAAVFADDLGFSAALTVEWHLAASFADDLGFSAALDTEVLLSATFRDDNGLRNALLSMDRIPPVQIVVICT